ncbi:DUF2268 domain-containing protein [Leifsonia sp. NPDC058292]|uniref:DUF2268 domain-containing protein n=1 Tax=Leifsonia sp. NPDC058292 TaxID=3346428 RepID=UPI0036DD1F0A
MTMTMVGTEAGMTAVLDAEPQDRAQRLKAMLAPAAGMYRYFPGEVDLVRMHAMSFGFPLDRSEETVRRGLEQLQAADAWGRIERAIGNAVEVQAAAVPHLNIPDLTVVLVLGDPDDEHFMREVRGLSGNGSVTGFLSLTIWPTEENLDRLEASAVHELHHNLRYAPGGVVWDPAAVTAGEQIVSEGLADAFARQLYGDERGYTPIGRPHLYDAAVFAKVVSGLEVAGIQNFAAWVLGDATAVRFGAQPVGLPTGAGYAAGNELVDRYLAATGSSAAEALHVPSRDIIDVALGRS